MVLKGLSSHLATRSHIITKKKLFVHPTNHTVTAVLWKYEFNVYIILCTKQPAH